MHNKLQISSLFKAYLKKKKKKINTAMRMYYKKQ